MKVSELKRVLDFAQEEDEYLYGLLGFLDDMLPNLDDLIDLYKEENQ